MPLQKIKFQTNINVEAALKYPEGKLCDSQFGDPQYMFTTTDDRVFFVAEKVAQKIHGLRLQPQEPFEICKKEVDYGNGRKGIEWQVAKVGFAAGEQPNGTFIVPAIQPGAGAVTPAPVATAVKQPAYNKGNGTKSNVQLEPTVRWALFLLAQTNDLVDVYALACKHASEKHGNLVRFEDVRSIMLSSFINVTKNGGING